MEIQFKKHVRIIFDLSIGESVSITGWGPALDNRIWIIEDIKMKKSCESGFMIKITGYDHYIDSGWVDKIIK